MNVIDLVSQNSNLLSWQQGLQKNNRELILGLSATTKAIVMASAFDSIEKAVLITSSYNEAERLASDFIALLGEEKVHTFLGDDNPLAEFIFASQERQFARLEALNFLCQEDRQGILVTNVSGIKLLLPSPKVFASSIFQLKVGQEIDLTTLSETLQKIGYQKVGQVLQQGEFSLRGDILDIFEIDQLQPYRIEFFGDEIDGIRIFDPESQRSVENVEEVQLKAVSDLLLQEEDFIRGQKQIEQLQEQSANEEFKSYLAEILGDISQRKLHPDLRKFISFFYEKQYTLFDYLPKHTPIFLDDYQKIADQIARFELDTANFLTEDLHKNRASSRQVYFADTSTTLRKYTPATYFSNFQKGLGNLKFDHLYQFNQYPMQEFFGQFDLLKEEIERYRKSNYTVIVQATSHHNLQQLHKNLEEYGIRLDYIDGDAIIPQASQLIVGGLAHGFQFVDEKIVYITESEIYQKKIKRKIRRQNISNAERLKNYNELEKGDYVVHQVHGIGQYLGIETIEISGVHRDYVSIQYQNGDRISIPVDQIQMLSKYVASDGKTPKINKLNDGRFQKTKQKVQTQVEDIADDLIKLYAERSQLEGFAYSSDDENQEAFEQDFPYIETDDQLRSIEEIKKDMESNRPMDRLLVGDVGFGKTEVAMRAAFKAVNDHKQVAVLVPTTVLAQQHYANFKERFESFAVEVAVLSRFQSKAEQKETLEKLKKKVDVLTLTATPIPRTLHMSMLGIRDLSVIETPPTNRYPVQTFVLETNPTIIRDAVLREIDRGGQVYYLYNKVDTIEQKVSELKELIPEASIGFVHGQMSEVRLENTLLDFINGEYDVLVTTTIIETGVDIPNANTLFIENADHMGLSTLYQLRGRVGRSNRIAYAYLMYRPDKSLTEVSEKRLEAIKGFTELGSGFKIAMRDLSIRGAGNILGASQSGFIDSVGFEMYSQLLEEAIAKKQGQEHRRQKSNAELNLQIDAYLPNEYISDQRQKIEIYKQIREMNSATDYEYLQDELIDRFGEYPDVVAYLLEIGLVKAYLDQVFVRLVERKQQKVTVKFEPIAKQLFLTQDYFKALSMTQLKAQIAEEKGLIEVIFDIRNKKDFEILEALKQFGQTLLEIKQEKEED